MSQPQASRGGLGDAYSASFAEQIAMATERLSKRRKLLGAEELDARLRLRYLGKTPKKRLTNNVNCYDHNILGLANRTVSAVTHDLDKSQDAVPLPLFESVDSLSKRSLSQPNVSSFLIPRRRGRRCRSS